MAGSIYRRATELMEADLGDELVALDSQRGQCFGFNAVATTVWRLLEQPKSFDQLRDGLLEEYDVGAEQCTSELQELMDALTDKGLITKSEAPREPVASPKHFG